jgi:hypothetical protein
MRCWGRCLSPCSGKPSREHLVSASLFEGTTIRVGGFPWCEDGEVEIGLASAVTKVLCRRHNELLSPVDAGGAAAFRTFREIRRLENVRDSLQPGRWDVKQHSIDGRLLERWFMKTAFNLACFQESSVRWMEDHGAVDTPPFRFVQAVYGVAAVPENVGLYFAVQPGQIMTSRDYVSFEPLLWLGAEIGGGAFEFRGFRFVLSLLDDPMPRQPPFLARLDEHWRSAKLYRHIKRIRVENRGFLSQDVGIEW